MSQIIDLINPTGSLMHVNKEYYEKNPDKFVEWKTLKDVAIEGYVRPKPNKMPKYVSVTSGYHKKYSICGRHGADLCSICDFSSLKPYKNYNYGGL